MKFSKNQWFSRSKRSRVYRHHAHMLKHVCAWCRYTRGRFERTHGGVLSGHTGREGGVGNTHTSSHKTQLTTTHGDRERQRETERDRERQRETERQRDREKRQERR